jgi:hypothetical protein
LRKTSISEDNKNLISEFALDCINHEVSHARVEKYIQQLRYLAEWLGKNFRDATKEDIIELIGRLEEATYVVGGLKSLSLPAPSGTTRLNKIRSLRISCQKLKYFNR